MTCARLANPDFAEWARSFGAEGIAVEAESQVEDAVAQAFAVRSRPVVLHVRTSPLQISAWQRYKDGDRLP